MYYDIAVNKETFEVIDEYDCPGCEAHLLKKNLDRSWVSYYDEALRQPHKLVRYAPVLISYQVGNKRYEKKPDADDLKLIEKIQSAPIPDWYPVYEMLEGERKGKDGYHLKGITHLHHFYFRRALMAYARLWQKVKPGASINSPAFLEFFVQGSCLGFTKMNRYQSIQFGRVGGSQVNRYFSGTLFVGSLISEVSPAYSMTHKLGRLIKLEMPGKYGGAVISCQSTTKISIIPDNSFDYVFVDPPFGNNLHYSELNFFWEAWLGILTERNPEAVMDKGRQRTLRDYQELMVQAFQEIYRVLKPGHWQTVEFHNSQNRVWNAIQEAMQRAGFVVADVRTLDKQQETYKQSIQQLVKQDLVISSYKPNDSLEERFRLEAGTSDGAWDFVRYHLTQLPRVVEKNGEIEVVAERQAFLLFDRMVAFHIQRGASVPLSAGEFYAGLKQKFVERDGMYFLPMQVAEYDAARLRLGRVAQLTFFVSDEKTAIQWLRQQLAPTLGGEPKTFADLQPQFMRAGNKAKHEQMPELGLILEQNFLEDAQGQWCAPDPSKATDLERLRHKALLREFNEYVQATGRLRQFRTEAVRAGFAEAYKNREYAVILQVAARLPETVLHEDPDLLMYFDTATLRTAKLTEH
ncbi:MAG: DNA methylase [Chloroflexota bacterium]